MQYQKRKHYSLEFKHSAINLALDTDDPIIETARALGIKETTLHTWIKNRSKLSEKSSIQSENSSETEISRLKRELIQVKLERDLLKKAAAYFAQEAK